MTFTHLSSFGKIAGVLGATVVSATAALIKEQSAAHTTNVIQDKRLAWSQAKPQQPTPAPERFSLNIFPVAYCAEPAEKPQASTAPKPR